MVYALLLCVYIVYNLCLWWKEHELLLFTKVVELMKIIGTGATHQTDSTFPNRRVSPNTTFLVFHHSPVQIDTRIVTLCYFSTLNLEWTMAFRLKSRGEGDYV